MGFCIKALVVGNWTKCAGNGEPRPIGSYAYKTWVNELHKGCHGLVTLAKVHGADHKYETLPNKEYH
ncbi:MAG: hypothetical protein H0X29_07110 [Parachlamydiaceae bacterium]|nr:hypothetical protein [Parachlamydiaceae bacterium]